MDWVETTGKSVDEATQRALEHLGVTKSDADVEILEEPKAGLFGRVRGEARVRARIRPSGPRPKRTRRSGGRDERPERAERPRRAEGSRQESGKASVGTANRPPRGDGRSGTKNSRNGATASAPRAAKGPVKEDEMAEGITLQEQGAIAQQFLEGLLQAMNITATTTVKEIDSETLEVAINADPPTELGVLVGPRGTTLQALQEITRTVVQSKSPARTDRILVDVAQYRERRVAALGRFARQVADDVRETGEERALEPMSAADRKAVHDALTDASDVVTRSEGEEPRRFVVVAPA